MKFKDLKTKEFIITFDIFLLSREYYNDYYYVDIIHRIINGRSVLSATYEAEYDNGLYVNTWREPFVVTWKDIKYNLTHYELRNQKTYKKPFDITIFKGKCEHCNKPIYFEDGVCGRTPYIGFICKSCEQKFIDTLCKECLS